MVIKRSIFDVNLLHMGTVIGGTFALTKGVARWGHRIIKHDPDLLFVSAVSYIFHYAFLNIIDSTVPARTDEERTSKKYITSFAALISIPLGVQAGTAVHHFCYPHIKISLNLKDNLLLSAIMIASYWISKNIGEKIW